MATTATYNPALPTDKDWVRFFTGDTDVDPVDDAELDDNEIAALLVEERNKYLASARAGECIIARGLDAVSKAVDDLKLDTSEGPSSAYRQHLQKLRERGAEIQLTNRRSFRLVGDKTGGRS